MIKFTRQPLYPREWTSGTHGTPGWVRHRARLYVVEKRRISYT